MGTYVGNDQELGKRYRWVYDLFPVLEKRKNQLAKTLSGGERQMLAVGRGLIQNPDLLMIDEPSLGLAPEAVSRLFKSLERVREAGIPIVLVEQNIYLSLRFADRGYAIENGRIIEEGDAKALLKNKKIKKAYLT